MEQSDKALTTVLLVGGVAILLAMLVRALSPLLQRTGLAPKQEKLEAKCAV